MVTQFFSDLDDTLAHRVRPQAGEWADVGNGYYIAEATLEGIRRLRLEKIGFGVVTTRRYSTAQTALMVIPHDYAIIDHGTVVVVRGEIDREWLDALKPYIGDPFARQKIGVLWDYEAQIRAELAREGFEIYSDERFGSFRVIPPPPRKAEDIQRLLHIGRPEGIESIVVRDFIDFFPSMAGKANGVKHVLSVIGVSDSTLVAYAGDDINDMACLAQFNPLTVKEADSSVKELVSARGGYIAQQAGHEATKDLISHVEAMSAQGRPQ